MNEIEQIQKDTKVITIINAMHSLEKQSNALEIKTSDNEKTAVTIAGSIKDLTKNIETYRKDYVNPHNLIVKSINAMFKPFKDKLSKIDSALRHKMIAYKNKQEAKLVKIAEKKDIPVQIEKSTRNENNTATYKTVWKFDITDETKVPRKYLAISDMAIRRAIADGVREIEGVKIYEDKVLSIR